jgi:hypothetical protein
MSTFSTCLDAGFADSKEVHGMTYACEARFALYEARELVDLFFYVGRWIDILDALALGADQVMVMVVFIQELDVLHFSIDKYLANDSFRSQVLEFTIDCGFVWSKVALLHGSQKSRDTKRLRMRGEDP